MPFVLLPPLVFALEQMVRFEQQLGRARRASLTRRLRESQRLRAADALCDGRIRTEKHFRPGRGHTRCRDAQHVGHVFRCAESALRRQLHHEAGRGALDHQRLVRRAVDARPLTLHRAAAAEEAFLAKRFAAAFETWVARTPRFLPRFSLCPATRSGSCSPNQTQAQNPQSCGVQASKRLPGFKRSQSANRYSLCSA
jgi:hypothetical protein